jgi:hypothetical protein
MLGLGKQASLVDRLDDVKFLSSGGVFMDGRLFVFSENWG